jgi:tripartite ATP-independent transporter DctP family solute receptor
MAAEAVAQSGVTVLRYGHMNPADSIPGIQANYFAEKVKEYTRGAVRVEVHPASLLGTLEEQLEQVTSGIIAIHHNTAGAFGSLAEDFSVLDTPYIYRDLDHLLKVTSVDSPVMKKLEAELLRKGVRVLYTFYFGTRQLTCDRPVKKPADLAGVKIRAIPFPIYVATIEGLGAIPVSIDWAQTPAALAAKAVSGQENPVNTVLTSRLYESQQYLILTSHIRAADIVVMNDDIWRRLGSQSREGVTRAAAEASKFGTMLTADQEKRDQRELEAKGMRVIGPEEGLDLRAFEANMKKILQGRYASRWGQLYSLIESLRG